MLQSIIDKIRNNVWLSLAFAIIAGIGILSASGYFGDLTTRWIGQFTSLNFYTNNIFMKAYMLLFSLFMVLLFNKWSFKGYGFNKPHNMKYLRFFFISTGIIIGAFIFANLIFNGILRTLFPTESGTPGLPESQSILEMILAVWIWSSICEEVLTRGFIQGFMNKHTHIRLLKLSLPVWVSGLFFGLMHLALLTINKDVLFVSFIVTNTTILGLLAAYYREKTKSIYPAIFLHFWANVIFSLPMFFI
ncbi:MAG TPA: CPBP family intramembrane glutamic endopeptidase [Bacteroidales bacterium]|nr:CPBP family intramembrane glutamic endopeptidase [Bacteroidales bacterium]